MAGGKRKRASLASESQHSSKRQKSTASSTTVARPTSPPCPPSSSPLKPLPEPGLRAATGRPTFERVQLEPFDRSISSNLPRNSLFDIFLEFCPNHIVDAWIEYINARHIFLPKYAQGPRQQRSLHNNWKPTHRQEIHLFELLGGQGAQCSQADWQACTPFRETTPMLTVWYPPTSLCHVKSLQQRAVIKLTM